MIPPVAKLGIFAMQDYFVLLAKKLNKKNILLFVFFFFFGEMETTILFIYDMFIFEWITELWQQYDTGQWTWAG